MSAHVLLNLLNQLRKKKIGGLQAFYPSFTMSVINSIVYGHEC